MHDPVLLGVREPGEQPLEHAGDLGERHLPDVAAQRPALDVLHRDVRRAVVLEVVVDRDDVRMRERPRDARLAQEALGERRVGRVEGGELLERDEAVEVGLPREVHHRHAAAADLPEDLVAADRLEDVGHQPLAITCIWPGDFTVAPLGTGTTQFVVISDVASSAGWPPIITLVEPIAAGAVMTAHGTNDGVPGVGRFGQPGMIGVPGMSVIRSAGAPPTMTCICFGTGFAIPL
jgi:hypothetical protein